MKDKTERVLIVGAGNGGELIANLLEKDKTKVVAGFVDDSDDLQNKTVEGYKVLGKLSDIPELKNKEKFDSMIISIATDMPVRRKIYEEYKDKFKFINTIHPSAVIDDKVKMGVGNMIHSAAHIGFKAEIGNNNVLATGSNIEHHNKLGDGCLIAPHCSTSGGVEIGDNVVLGIGVAVQWFVKIGSNVNVASGKTVFFDIPDNKKSKSIIKATENV